MKKSNRKIILLCFFIFLGMLIFGGYSIWRELSLSDPNYINQELDRLAKEEEEERLFWEMMNSDPELIDMSKLTPEQKEEVMIAKMKEGYENGVYINDYMKEMTEDIKTTKRITIDMYLDAFAWKEAIEEAKGVKKIYDLTNDEEFFTYINNISMLEFVYNNALDDVSKYWSGFTTPEYMALGFALSNTNSQANGILIKESEVLPVSREIEVIDCISYGLEKMNAAGMFVPAKNYSGYRVKLLINNSSEYFVYLVYDKTSATYNVFRTSEVGNNEYSSSNNYKNFLD